MIFRLTLLYILSIMLTAIHQKKEKEHRPMKKALVIILAAMMVLTFAFSVSAYDAVNVYKAKTAPVIDGVVSSDTLGAD